MRATNLRAQLIQLRTNVGKRPIREHELIYVRELIEEIRYIYIYIWTPTPITLPCSQCAYGVTRKEKLNHLISN